MSDFSDQHLSWEEHKGSHIETPAVTENVFNLLKRRGKNENGKIASLLRAVTCMDLTTLCGDDSASNVQRLCCKAAYPISSDILVELGIDHEKFHCAAVCVYPDRVHDAVSYLKELGKTDIKVASVAAGFPCGQYPLQSRLAEIETSVHHGAKEIDIVVNRDLIIRGDWQKLHSEVEKMKTECSGVTLKAIISAGELASFSNIYRASIVCMAAGADFIKTSTGKESVNATLPIGTIMTHAIRRFYNDTGIKVGFKPAGGIKTSNDVLKWQDLMQNELGNEYLYPNRFRIGASSLLGDIEQTIYQYLTDSCIVKCEFPFL